MCCKRMSGLQASCETASVIVARFDAAVWYGTPGTSRHRRILDMAQRAPAERRKSRGRGFASMDREKQRQIASRGGHAAHEQGTAHEWTSDEARVAGRKGGSSSHNAKPRE